MKKVFPAQEMAFKEKDGSFYAVSMSFGLFAEGETAEEALKRLSEATIGYLKMCLEGNEKDKDIYRGVPKEYNKMYDLFLSMKKSVTNKPVISIVKKSPFARIENYNFSNKNLVCA